MTSTQTLGGQSTTRVAVFYSRYSYNKDAYLKEYTPSKNLEVTLLPKLFTELVILCKEFENPRA